MFPNLDGGMASSGARVVYTEKIQGPQPEELMTGFMDEYKMPTEVPDLSSPELVGEHVNSVLPPPGAETLGDALADLPSEALDFASDFAADWIDMDSIMSFVQPFVMPIASIFGGLPLMLLAYLGIKAAGPALKKRPSNVLYSIDPKNIDAFIQYASASGAPSPLFVNRQSGLIAMPRGSAGKVDALADQYRKSGGAVVVRAGG